MAGCSLLWFVGRRGGEALLERRFGRERTARTRDAYRRWGILALAVPAIFPPPVPFKIFVLASGVFGFPFGRFLVTLLLARVEDRDAKRRMPPGKREAWTDPERKLLRDFVRDLHQKQQKK